METRGFSFRFTVNIALSYTYKTLCRPYFWIFYKYIFFFETSFLNTILSYHLQGALAICLFNKRRLKNTSNLISHLSVF